MMMMMMMMMIMMMIRMPTIVILLVLQSTKTHVNEVGILAGYFAVTPVHLYLLLRR